MNPPPLIDWNQIGISSHPYQCVAACGDSVPNVDEICVTGLAIFLYFKNILIFNDLNACGDYP